MRLDSTPPTQRLTLRTPELEVDVGCCSSIAIAACSITVQSRWSSSTGGGGLTRWRGAPSGTSGKCRICVRSTPRAFQWSIAAPTSSRSVRPISSSTVRMPSEAMISRSSSATKKQKFTTCSGWPLKRLRSSGSCVAMPTGQVFRWQARIMMQPVAISGAVEKPTSSAPSTGRSRRRGRS